MLRNTLLYIIILASSISAWGLSVHSIPYDSVESVVYRDTLFDKSLPPVELSLSTYSNYKRTTVGYQLILRDAELEIQDVELFIGEPQRRHSTIKPFRLHIGDSLERNRIDRVTIWNKFPYDTIRPLTDSLVIHTDRGDYTVYLGEERRLQKSLAEQQNAYEKSLTETKSRYLSILVGICVVLFIAIGVAVFLSIRAKRRRDEVVNNLVMLFADNERINSELNKKVQSLFKQKFDTLNKLCFEYFEKGDTPILRKSIYRQVENEILRLREPEEIDKLEESLNRYCDNIMEKVDTQLPKLSSADRTLLLYLFSGFSARTICVLSDVEIKTFYMRRYRLKNKILSSDAPDKEMFAENM